MEITTESEIDLFAENTPSLEQIKEFCKFVNSSEANQIAFREQVEANMDKTSQQGLLATGIGLFIVDRGAEAVEKLKKANDCKEKFVYLAFALRQIGEYDQAIKSLQKSLDYDTDALFVAMEKAATYRCASNPEAAAKELEGCANFTDVSAEYHYQLGRLHEAQGLYGQAMDNYKKTLELSPDHHQALFYLAYRCDLSGDEDAAIDYYKQLVSTEPVYVSALLNLAVLYEDNNEFDRALRCVDKVLDSYPNHQRAIMFNKDIESSLTMVYDEEKEKKQDRKNQILETPISDFELSVRSRNCLKKMNITTLGDLLKITEAELLAYKNFGETSLREIKRILGPRNLHLGMALEEQQSLSQPHGEGLDINADEELLNKSVDEMQLSVRARKCLQNLNIHTINELIQRTDAELLGSKNFGVTSLNEIKKILTNLGLSLRSLE